MYLRTDGNPSVAATGDVSLTYRSVQLDAPCASPPANTSRATALPLPPSTPTTGRFCGTPVDVRYWWRIAGNYTVGQRHRLQVTFDAGRLAENVNFAVLLPQADGSLASIASCTASAGSPEDCTASITVPATEVFVTTTSNPVPDRRDETFSLTFSPL